MTRKKPVNPLTGIVHSFAQEIAGDAIEEIEAK